MRRPIFGTAWAASLRIYSPSDTGTKVANVIGGKVADNIRNPDPSQRWSNTCAVRMSYILNYSGALIPYIGGQTVSGGDKRWYFFRVRDLIVFLRHRWGKPEAIAYPPSEGGRLLGYKLVFLTVRTFEELPTTGRKLVALGLIRGNLHIRIFSGDGHKITDCPESRMTRSTAINGLKRLVGSGLDPESLPEEKTQEIVDDAVFVTDSKTLVSRQGLILFEVSGWSDAAGHATLWNGRSCYDHCYFNEPGATYRTERANFWSLP